MSDLDELMHALQRDGHGQALLESFDHELEQSWRAKRPKTKDLPLSLHNAEASYAERLQAASVKAAARAGGIADGYVAAVDAEVRKAVDQAGLGVACDMVNNSVERVSTMEATLLDQRDPLKQNLVDADTKATAAFESLAEAAPRVRTGWLKGIAGPLEQYLEAATAVFGLRFALTLTEGALAALGSARSVLQDLASHVESERHILQLCGEQCGRTVEEFESRVVTPIEEITERPLYDAEQLHALYRDMIDTVWDSIGDELADTIWHRLGGLARLLGLHQEIVYDELLAAAVPSFEPAARMTADDFIRWKYAREERAADLFLRDCDLAAPILCRVDRARLPEGSFARETSFRIIGVPDRDGSVFFGTPHALLATTGDPKHVVFLKLRLGFPPSALWQFERYGAAHDEIGRAGRVAQGIYRGFPHEISRRWYGRANARRTRTTKRRRPRR